MQDAEFALLLDKALHADLQLCSYCPTQDMIACCFSDQISCHRLNWQRLWTYQLQEDDGVPSALVWHPDAKYLGVGYEGSVSLLDSESGELCRKARVAEGKITGLSWLEGESLSASEPSIYDTLEDCTGQRGLAPPASKLATLCVVDSTGCITLLTAGLSKLACFHFADLVGKGPGRKRSVRILNAAATRSLMYLYVIWDSVDAAGNSSDPTLSVLHIHAIGQGKTQLRVISGILEQAIDLRTECSTLIQQAEDKWKSAVDAITGLKAGLAQVLEDMGFSGDEDVEQLERLLLLGESASLDSVLRQFLTSTIGETGIKRTAKAVDAALSHVVTSIVTDLQPRIQSLMGLMGKLYSILLCEPSGDALGIQSASIEEARQCTGTLLMLSTAIALWTTHLQAEHRKFFAWLLYIARSMNTETAAVGTDQINAKSKSNMPSHTESILDTLARIRSREMSTSIFDTQVPSVPSRLSQAEEHDWQLGEGAGFKKVLAQLQQLCCSSLRGIPPVLSERTDVVQHIVLPASACYHPAAVLSLAQSSKDSADTSVQLYKALGKASDSVLLLRLVPPQPHESGEPHQVYHATLKLSADEAFVDMAALRMETHWLALLLRQKRRTSQGFLDFLPLHIARFAELPHGFQQVVQASPSMSHTDAEGRHRCNLGDGSFQGPLVTSSSRRMVCVLASSRRLHIYDLEDLGAPKIDQETISS